MVHLDKVQTDLTIAALSVTVGAALSRQHQRVRNVVARAREERAYRRGVKEIPGVIPEVPRAPVRTQRLERDMRTVKHQVGEMNTQLMAVAAIVGEIPGIKSDLQQMLSSIAKLFRNGDNTNFPGDMLARLAEREGLLVPGHTGHLDDQPSH